MKKNIWILLICAVALFGLLVSCVSTASLQATLNTWVGATENEIIRRWGIPNQKYDTDDVRFIRYVIDERVDSSTNYYGDDDTFFFSTSSTQQQKYSCIVEFALENDAVVSANLRGERQSIFTSDSTLCNQVFTAERIKSR